jgi:ATP-binding cassette subfamily C (CFTR/MRP) protein 1
MPQFMSAALTFAVFAVISAATHDKSLLVAQAFTSLSLISLLTYPLNQLVPSCATALSLRGMFRSHRGIPRPTGKGQRV